LLLLTTGAAERAPLKRAGGVEHKVRALHRRVERALLEQVGLVQLQLACAGKKNKSRHTIQLYLQTVQNTKVRRYELDLHWLTITAHAAQIEQHLQPSTTLCNQLYVVPWTCTISFLDRWQLCEPVASQRLLTWQRITQSQQMGHLVLVRG